jgi:hydrogenase maturation protease
VSAQASAAVVIGYGNTLRGDDGVGRRVASLVARCRPDVRTLEVHQLTPELAAVVAECEIAVFVDARADGGRDVEVRPVAPVAPAPALGHVASPSAVLALGAALYGRCPRAWTVGVPVERLGFGLSLSPAARSAAHAALAAVTGLLPPVDPAIAAAPGRRPRRARRRAGDPSLRPGPRDRAVDGRGCGAAGRGRPRDAVAREPGRHA